MPLESYENMKLLLKRPGMKNIIGKSVGILKVIAILLGLQLCYTKFYALCVSRTVETEKLSSKNSDFN
jgi:hypothetical protein